MTTLRGTRQQLEAVLLDAVRDFSLVRCRVVGAEEPLDLSEGLRWLDDGLGRGLEVDYRLVAGDRGDDVDVWLLRWDPDEPRPDWPEPWPEEERGRPE